MHAVEPYIESGELDLVPGAPNFSFPVYAAHSVNVDPDVLRTALTVLRTISAAQAGTKQRAAGRPAAVRKRKRSHRSGQRSSR